MSEVQQNQQPDRAKYRKVRTKKLSTFIDMTPMVDLAFLLLTFFMLTTTFSKPKAMEISMPVDAPPSPIDNNAVTVLLGDHNRVFWYYGEFKPGITKLEESKFASNGIRKVLIEKNEYAFDKVKGLESQLSQGKIAEITFKESKLKIQSDKKSLFVLIKTDDKAKYQNVIDMIDECSITNVGKYAVVDMMPEEAELLKEKYVK